MLDSVLQFLVTVPVADATLRAAIILAELLALGVVLHALWTAVEALVGRRSRALPHPQAVDGESNPPQR